MSQPADGRPIDALRRTLIADPCSIPALAHLARAWIAEGADNRAGPPLRALRALAPQVADPHAHRGSTLIGEGRLAEARWALRETRQMHPASGESPGPADATLMALDALERGLAVARARAREMLAAGAPMIRRPVELSILIAALRPELLATALPAIRLAIGTTPYEIVVVSPFPVSAPDVVWVDETKPRGSPAAYVAAYAASCGDVVAVMSEDLLPAPGMLDLMVEFVRRGERSHFPFAAGARWIVHNKHDVVGTVYGRYYPYLPALSRRSVERIGGWYDPEFRAGWADSDLALRIWQAGGRCELCRAALVYSHPFDAIGGQAPAKSVSGTADRDFARFRARWHPIFGAGWGERPEDVNADRSPQAMIGDTIFEPAPPPRS
jgi:hypothetical protein